MSETEGRHMDQTELLTYVDGELRPSEAAAAEKHLADCPECRVRIAQMRSDLDDVITRHRERKIAALRGGPEWADLSAEFDRLDDRKTASRLLAFPVRGWMGVAAAGLIAALVWNLSTDRTVSAAELLEKASSKPENSQTDRRIVIKTRRQQFIRPARLGNVREPQAAAANDASELRSLFQQANFSWDDPLSARSFARWRDQLHEKQDQVTLMQSGADRLYRIRTTTAQSVLSEAILMMRVDDLRAVRETLRFGDRELVDIAETAPAEPGVPTVPRPAGARIATQLPAEVETPVGPGEELRVLAALSEIGADLGEPIDVKRDDRRITISGTAVGTRRQQQIRDAVRDIPGVAVAFTEGQPIEATTTRQPADTVTASRRSALHDQLEARLGAGEQVDAFVDRIVAESESALARAHALRNLAARFPPDVDQALSPGDQRILGDLRRRHLQALQTVSQSIERQIQETFGVGAQENPRACNGWQDCTSVVLAASQRFDELLNSALAGAVGGNSPTAGDLTAALTAWRQQIAALAQVAGTTR